MTKAEFEQKMDEADRQLIARRVPVRQRLVLACFYLTDERSIDVSEWDPHRSPYEGSNLCLSVSAWYRERYPTQATIGYEWGPRLLVIRGEVFRADIPVHFNPRALLDAFKFIPDLTLALRGLLDPREQDAIQVAYNRFFMQASDLALNWVRWCVPRRGVISDLIDRGLGDLKASCDAYSDLNPTSVLFTAQQGPEKYLKAMIAAHDRALTDRNLKNRYNHNIPVLLEACTRIDPGFAILDERIHRLGYGQEVRYKCQPMSGPDVVEIIDLSYDVCHAVAIHMLSSGDPDSR